MTEQTEMTYTTVKRSFWSGWFIAAAMTGVFGWYLGGIQEHSVYDAGMNPRYSCGTAWNPTYPMDGNGPCTAILENAQLLPWLWIGAAVVLAVIGYVRMGKATS